MKNIFILFVFVSLIACTKTRQLKSDQPILLNSYAFCISFQDTLNTKQLVRSKYKKSKVYYHYNLNDFLGDLRQGTCNEYSVVLKKINVLGGFVTVKAGVSLNRFNIEATVEMYKYDNSIGEKTYKTQVDSETRFFLASNNKQYEQDSVALKKGLNNILDQIALDVKNNQ